MPDSGSSGWLGVGEPWGSLAGPFLINVLWVSTLVVLGVCLAAGLLRGRSAVLRHGLWRVAWAGFVLSPALVGVAHWGGWPTGPGLGSLSWERLPHPVQIILSPFPDPLSRKDASPQTLPTSSSLTVPPAPGPEASSGTGAPPPSPSSETSPSWVKWGEGAFWVSLAAFLWLAGVILGLLRLGWQSGKLIGLVRRGEPLEEEELLGWIQTVNGLKNQGRPVQLRRSPEVSAPLACGLRTPYVLLPWDFAAKSQGEELRAVLLHEVAHIRRGDLWLQLGFRLTQVFWFFHPLLYLVGWQLRRTAEEACDDWVVVSTATPTPYVRVLIRLAEAPSPRRVLGWSLSRRPASGLKRRVTRILAEEPRRALHLAGRGWAVLVGVGLLSGGLGLVTRLEGSYRAPLSERGVSLAAQLAPFIACLEGPEVRRVLQLKPPSPITDLRLRKLYTEKIPREVVGLYLVRGGTFPGALVLWEGGWTQPDRGRSIAKRVLAVEPGADRLRWREWEAFPGLDIPTRPRYVYVTPSPDLPEEAIFFLLDRTTHRLLRVETYCRQPEEEGPQASRRGNKWERDRNLEARPAGVAIPDTVLPPLPPEDPQEQQERRRVWAGWKRAHHRVAQAVREEGSGTAYVSEAWGGACWFRVLFRFRDPHPEDSPWARAQQTAGILNEVFQATDFQGVTSRVEFRGTGQEEAIFYLDGPFPGAPRRLTAITPAQAAGAGVTVRQQAAQWQSRLARYLREFGLNGRLNAHTWESDPPFQLAFAPASQEHVGAYSWHWDRELAATVGQAINDSRQRAGLNPLQPAFPSLGSEDPGAYLRQAIQEGRMGVFPNPGEATGTPLWVLGYKESLRAWPEVGVFSPIHLAAAWEGRIVLLAPTVDRMLGLLEKDYVQAVALDPEVRTLRVAAAQGEPMPVAVATLEP